MATKKSKKSKKARSKKAVLTVKTEKVPEKKVSGRKSENAPLDGVIKVLRTNPKRPGSAAGKRFDLYKKDMTVAEFLKAGGWRADISWDLKQGFIEVAKPQ